jgi:adenine-specific DNA methylase
MDTQLAALATLSDLISEARNAAIADGAELEYANAIACYLAFAVSKAADYNCTGAVWFPQEDRPKTYLLGMQFRWFGTIRR